MLDAQARKLEANIWMPRTKGNKEWTRRPKHKKNKTPRPAQLWPALTSAVQRSLNGTHVGSQPTARVHSSAAYAPSETLHFLHEPFIKLYKNINVISKFANYCGVCRYVVLVQDGASGT